MTTLVKPPKMAEIVEAGISAARQHARVLDVRAAKIEEEYNGRHFAALNDDAARLYAAFTAHIAQSGGAQFDTMSCKLEVNLASNVLTYKDLMDDPDNIMHMSTYEREIGARLKRHFAAENMTLMSFYVHDVDLGVVYRTTVRDGECQLLCCISSLMCCVPLLAYWLPMYAYHRCCKTTYAYHYSATLVPAPAPAPASAWGIK